MTVLVLILYAILGVVLSHAGLTFSGWEYWAALALVICIDVVSHINARMQK